MYAVIKSYTPTTRTHPSCAYLSIRSHIGSASVLPQRHLNYGTWQVF